MNNHHASSLLFCADEGLNVSFILPFPWCFMDCSVVHLLYIEVGLFVSVCMCVYMQSWEVVMEYVSEKSSPPPPPPFPLSLSGKVLFDWMQDSEKEQYFLGLRLLFIPQSSTCSLSEMPTDCLNKRHPGPQLRSEVMEGGTEEIMNRWTLFGRKVLKTCLHFQAQWTSFDRNLSTMVRVSAICLSVPDKWDVYAVVVFFCL